MNQKSDMRLLAITLANLFFCLSVLFWLFPPNLEVIAQGQPPEAFLGPIYYGSHSVNAVFDHWFPYLSLGIPDPNNCTQHYDGSTCNDDPPNGYGYDEHDGIDYGLSYVPVLAAANGTVYQAGWSNPANHRDGLGLRVRINHTNGYRTEYGHLSTINIQTNDLITANPETRKGIIGISGNTGNVLGWNCDPDDTPTCGAHLHFGLVNPDGIRVNPYGWIGDPGTDPWELSGNGAASHNLWETPPAITTNQYLSGAPVADPPVNHYLIEADDSDDVLFSTFGSCWTDVNNAAGIHGDYHSSLANSAVQCYAQWSFDPNAFAPAGEYDVYVHVPNTATSLSAEYTVYSHGGIHTAVIVQAAYPNDWAYLGRYYFSMNGSNEYIILYNQNLTPMTDDTNNVLIADAIRLLPAEARPDIEIPIVASTDDAGLNYLCSYSVAHNEIYLGHCPDGTNIVSGFRFQNVSVPQGTAISAARIEFTVDGAFTTNIDVQFRGEMVADAAAFSDTNQPSDRNPLTTAVAPWHLGSEDEWLSWHTRHSPDLSTIIEEIVNRTDWVSGNDLVIIVQPSGSGTVNRRVFAWDRMDNALQTARLQVWYAEAPSPTPTATPIPPTVTPTAMPAAIHVNFQPGWAAVPGGYFKDDGSVYGNRGNGYSYGWNANITSTGRDRNSSNSPDQRYDTLLHMQKSEAPDAFWEIAVPNGNYEVHLAAGDADWYDSIYKIKAEGVLIIDGVPNTTNRWVEGTMIIPVNDGRLTITNAPGADNNKINFIDITATSVQPTPTATPGGSGDVFQESGGQVLIEAEHFATQSVGSAGDSWVATTSYSGYSGNSALQALPNNGTNTGLNLTGPELTYEIAFQTSGTYYVHIRGTSSSANDDSVHVGLNGVGVTLAGFGISWGDAGEVFVWRGRYNSQDATINIPAAELTPLICGCGKMALSWTKFG